MDYGPIPIVAMRSWGQLGNFLAARTLGLCLAQHPAFSPQVLAAEDFLPRLQEIGRRIEQIQRAPERVAGRRRAYWALMDEVGELFYPGFEGEKRIADPLSRDIEVLVDFLRQTQPPLVIGTKGVISRLLLVAIRRAGLPTQLVNFVTNEGLLRLAIHRSTLIRHHLLAFESGRRYLLEKHAYQPHQLHVVGRLITTAEEPEAPEKRGQVAGTLSRLGSTSLRALIFSNQGGAPYLEPLREIGSSNQEVSLLFIGYNDRRLVGDARELQRLLGIEQMQAVDRLDHGEYVRCVRWLSGARFPLLISKAGPNTMLEAAYFGIPQLLLSSGLPAEDWVGRFVEEHGFGLGFEEMAALVATLSRWLDRPEEIARCRRNARRFAEGLLDQGRVKSRIHSVIGGILEGRVGD